MIQEPVVTASAILSQLANWAVSINIAKSLRDVLSWQEGLAVEEKSWPEVQEEIDRIEGVGRS